MKQLIKITKALSDKNRITILKLLAHKCLCVCELQAVLEITQPTVSAHLRILQDAGLINYHKEGRWIIYRPEKIKNSHITKLINNILCYLESDQEIKAQLNKLEKTNRHDVCCSKRKQK